MFRKIQLIGNVGKDPEIKNTQNGGRLASFSVAVNETWKSNGEKKQRTTWFNVVAFQNTDRGLVTDLIQPYVAKGQLLFIDGTPSLRKWTTQDGQDRWAFEVVLDMNSTLKLLGGNGQSQRREPGNESEDDRPTRREAPSRSTPDLDDDIPF